MLARVLGLDVGGANLKVARSDGLARTIPFPLWKQPDRLAEALGQTVRSFRPVDRVAVTMTGELCDCYSTKRAGVLAILRAVREACGGEPVQVWRNDGRFIGCAEAEADPLPSAAANWLVLAVFAGRFAARDGAILIDVGSTTTDIVPLWQGRPVPRGLTDFDRMASGELVYTGVRRTPVCALLGTRGAAEFFATMHDVFLVLGDAAEDASDVDTADGKPATRPAALARLARMIGGDLESCHPAQIEELARTIVEGQVRVLARALAGVVRSLPAAPSSIVTSGSGEFLARRLVHASTLQSAKIISLAGVLGSEISQAACAYAAAVLALEQTHG